MNKDRRKALTNLQEQLQALRGQMDDIRSGVESLRDEEQEYLDAMPESFAEGDKGSQAQEAVDAIESVLERFECIDTECEEAEQAFDTATQ